MGMPLPPAVPLSTDQVRIRSAVARAGLAGAWCVIALLIYANLDSSAVEDSSFDALAAVAIGMACLLWITMWLEFARERPIEYPYVWAFLLMTGPVLGPQRWPRKFEQRNALR
jgi:hypothetical protein